MSTHGNFDANTSNFKWLVAQFTEIIDVLVYVIFAATLAVIIWQIINAWILHGGDEMKVKEGKKTILIGFIVLVVMSSVWGIVNLLQSSLFNI